AARHWSSSLCAQYAACVDASASASGSGSKDSPGAASGSARDASSATARAASPQVAGGAASSASSLARNSAGSSPPLSTSTPATSPRPCQVAGASTGASGCASSPWRRVSRCPERLPLSTVDTYRGGSGCSVSVSYQL